MDGWMDEGMYELMDSRMDEWMDKRRDGLMNTCKL